MIGDQADITARLQRWLPARWFPTQQIDERGRITRIWAMLSGAAAALSTVYGQIQYAKLQTRLATLTDAFADLAAYDFFGYALRRRTNETDATLTLRVRKEIGRERNTRQAVIKVLEDLTGNGATVFEPINPADTGGWDSVAWGWDTGNSGFGDSNLPYQAFITAYRPLGGGIAAVDGWDGGLGAWDEGVIEWVESAMEVVPVSDADIYAAVNSVRPAGILLWVAINGGANAPSPSILGQFVLGQSVLQTGTAINPALSLSFTLSGSGGSGPPSGVAPAQVMGVAASQIAATSFTLNWTPDTIGTPPVTYTVFWGAHGSTNLVTPPNGTGLANATFLMSGATAGASYDVQVQASNAYGVGARSAVITVTIVSAGGGGGGTNPNDPSLVVPATMTAVAGIATPVSGVTFTDSAAQTASGTLSLNLTCNGGTISAHNANNVAIPGSGTQSIHYNGAAATWANVQAAISSITFTGSAAGNGAVTVDVWDQQNREFTQTTQITVSAGASGGGGGGTGGGGGGGAGTFTSYTANRVADMMDGFGVNTFSALPDGTNIWGSWPADYSVSSTAAGLNWLTNNSGLSILCREYHYNTATSNQSTWCPQIASQAPAQFMVCLGMGATATEASGLLSLAHSSDSGSGWMLWMEGTNEPNDLGNLTPAQTLAAQAAIWNQGVSQQILGPSIVIGTPYPEGYETPAYFSSAQITTLNSEMDYNSVHYYPSQNPSFGDGSSRPSEMADIFTGLSSISANKPQCITEWHPTLYLNPAFYNGISHQYDEAYDAYYAPIFILEAFRLGYLSYVWYSLFDFGAQWGLGPCTVTAGGHGFANGTYTLGVSAPGAGGTAATATYTCSGGAVTSIAVSAIGALYNAPTDGPPPTLSFPSGGGSGAAATATVVHAGGYLTGLFPKTGPVNPRKGAYAIRAMYTLTGDPNPPNRHSFTPDSLTYSITGLQPPVDGTMPRTGGQHMLFENSAGTFFLYIWNSQQNPGGSTSQIVVSFQTAMASIKEYTVSSGLASSTTPNQSLPAGSTSITFQLDASVHLIVLSPHGTRNPNTIPFASNSVWNIGVGSGATWSVNSDADATQLHGLGGSVNTTPWGQPIYFGTASDPLVTITCTDNLFPVPAQQVHVPIGAKPALGSGGFADAHMSFWDSTKPTTLWSYWGCSLNNGHDVTGGITAGLGGVWDATGDGVTNTISPGTDYDYAAGVITDYDMSIGAINHAVRVAISIDALRSPGSDWEQNIPWPNFREDYSGPQVYTGTIIAGSTFGIPASVNLATLGLTQGGMMLATALQKYGAIWRDSGGSNQLTFYSTPNQLNNPLIAQMQSDLSKIIPKIQIMRNQSATNINGGGTYPTPLPPVG